MILAYKYLCVLKKIILTLFSISKSMIEDRKRCSMKTILCEDLKYILRHHAYTFKFACHPDPHKQTENHSPQTNIEQILTATPPQCMINIIKLTPSHFPCNFNGTALIHNKIQVIYSNAEQVEVLEIHHKTW